MTETDKIIPPPPYDLPRQPFVDNDEGNPYNVVREESTEFMDSDGSKITNVKGYDAMGRNVFIATHKDYPDGQKGHTTIYVNEAGYWCGGAYNFPDIGIGCTFAPVKFKDE